MYAVVDLGKFKVGCLRVCVLETIEAQRRETIMEKVRM